MNNGEEECEPSRTRIGLSCGIFTNNFKESDFSCTPRLRLNHSAKSCKVQSGLKQLTSSILSKNYNCENSSGIPPKISY